MDNTTQRLILKATPFRSVQRRDMLKVFVNDPDSGKLVDTGQVTGDNKARGAGETLCFVPDRARGVFVTGLEELVPNPFKSLSTEEIKGKYGTDESWTIPELESIAKQEQISRQVWYEILDRVPKDHYNPRLPKEMVNQHLVIRTDFSGPRTFIESFEINLNAGTNVFLMDTPRGRMAKQVILNNHKLVAKSREEMDPTRHHWYLAEIDEDILMKEQVDDLENRAIAALLEISDKFPEFKLYQFAVLLARVSGEVSHRVVKDQINRYLKNVKGKDHQENLRTWLKWYDVFRENPALFQVSYVVRQAINLGVLYFDSGHMYWKSKFNNPTVYRWRDTDHITRYLLKEYETYNPVRADEDQVNYYAELVSEVKARGIKVD